VTVPTGPPIGNLEAVSVSPGSVSVRGWAIDPDVTRSIKVHVKVDGVAVGTVASGSRPDVAAAFPGYGPDHGFSKSVTASPGAHQVCAHGINVGSGRNTLLGCRTVTVPR
jgi:hypothetical protein